VETKKILDAFMKTPGEMRIVSSDVLKDSIKEGVEKGLLGLGYVENETPKCKYFKKSVLPELVDNEIIINPGLCVEETTEVEKGEAEELAFPLPSIEEPTRLEKKEQPPYYKEYKRLHIKLNTPPGQISNIAKIANYLKTLFNECVVKIEIFAQNGSIKVTDYENKIEEALRQVDIEIEEESKE